MNPDNQIPGLHRRDCPSCGRSNLLTHDVTTMERRGKRVETRQGMCTGCGKPIIYTIPIDATESTSGNVTAIGEMLRRWRTRRPRESTPE